ncbi:type II toxin-antitoxin system PemK/MazF family toxin [Limosilactobacillus antri]|uniref:mRNA interferase n=1 Tax=Limosilactobacillus antri DSM 16041 TaxID=525309 RepID=C8P4K7_9LACO|nr:type II toxin-antitoxin system PemK/MazF family toxin [Limosilactobacillus antri]EEW54627.1 toxin-antitoxin system, toxin component, MazF family [Limosilactobacillus antri DSM 16041]KRK60792.1 MazF family toxin-antitoxin system [Limosilactobacillus antri DSM 16041]
MTSKRVKRGEIFYADLSPVVGSEQGGVRPVLILQNDVGNHYSPTVIVAAITTQLQKSRLPTHVFLPHKESSLTRNSVILLEQVRTIDKQRLQDRIAKIGPARMTAVNHALQISLGLGKKEK